MPPVGVAIAAVSASITGSAAFAFATQTILGRLMVSVAASALMQALTAPEPPQGGGIATTVTQTGGLNPCIFPLGPTATEGQMMCPPMSHGQSGKAPNAYLTYVILLSNVPGTTLDQLIINNEAVTLGTTAHPDYGLPVQGQYQDYAWVKLKDGSQVTADPHLLATYASYPTRPWSSAMIGRNLVYAICTFRLNDELWQGLPRIRFVLSGIPLYDIRKDSTAGGSGSHRWANRATWEPSDNPFVQIYNVKRGIRFGDGDVWGGGMLATALNTASFVAAMNECDRLVPKSGGGTEKQFRAGIEVSVDRAPADIIRELLKASSGQLVDMGGLWKARAGGPGLPILYISDGDVVISKPQEFKPFPGLENSWNAITASYPEPASLWEAKDAPPRYNTDWEGEDQGRRRVAHLELPAVPYAAQVQRIMRAYIEEERRFRRHALTLPPDAAILEPLDAIGWTSPVNGYVTKVFEVAEVADDLRTCLQRTALRERDPNDYDYPANMFLPSAIAAPGPVRPSAQTVPGFIVEAINILDGGGTARRPAVRLRWAGDGQDDVTGLEWEVRLAATGVLVSRGSTQTVTSGLLNITSGILPQTAYQARARFLAPRATTWTNWIASVPALTPALYTNTADLAGQSVTAVARLFKGERFGLTGTGWVRRGSISVPRKAGFPTLFRLAFSYDGGGTQTVSARILRGSQEIANATFSTGPRGAQHQGAWTALDAESAGGTVTYHLEFRRGSLNGASFRINGWNVFFDAEQVFR
jgi:hypothetical protein